MSWVGEGGEWRRRRRRGFPSDGTLSCFQLSLFLAVCSSYRGAKVPSVQITSHQEDFLQLPVKGGHHGNGSAPLKRTLVDARSLRAANARWDRIPATAAGGPMLMLATAEIKWAEPENLEPYVGDTFPVQAPPTFSDAKNTAKLTPVCKPRPPQAFGVQEEPERHVNSAQTDRGEKFQRSEGRAEENKRSL